MKARSEPDSNRYQPTRRIYAPDEDAISGAGFDTPWGTAWTTSALCCETIPEIEAYGDDGGLTVDTEAAAIWAVCQYRGVDTASVHELGGVLTPEECGPEPERDRGVVEMFDPVVVGLQSHVARDDRPDKSGTGTEARRAFAARGGRQIGSKT